MGWSGVERRRRQTSWTGHERRTVPHIKKRDDGEVTPGAWTPADSGILYSPSTDSSSDTGSDYSGGGGSFDGGGASGDY